MLQIEIVPTEKKLCPEVHLLYKLEEKYTQIATNARRVGIS